MRKYKIVKSPERSEGSQFNVHENVQVGGEGESWRRLGPTVGTKPEARTLIRDLVRENVSYYDEYGDEVD